MGAAKPGPVPKVFVLQKRDAGPVMPSGLTAAQETIWREMAANPHLAPSDFPLLDEAVTIMRIRDRAWGHVQEFGSTISNNRGNQLMNPEYKVFKEMTEALMKLRERMLLTPQTRLRAGNVDDPNAQADNDLETD